MGSIAAAARAMGMSYRRAWMLIDETTTAFGAPVVIAASGGANGGRAELTNLGLDIVTLFRRMEETAAKALAPELDALLRLAAH
jgi:molybdate transport system regulatory protein